MLFEENDFIFYNLNNKNMYGYIRSVKDSTNTISVEDSLKISTNDITENDILYNFGQNPPLEDFKIDVNFGDIIIDNIGVLSKLRSLTNDEEEFLKKSFKNCEKVINLFDFRPHYILKYNKSLTKQCNFKYNKKEDELQVILTPADFSIDNLNYVIYKAIGKIIFSQELTDQVKGKWIKVYDKNITRKSLTDSELENLRSSFVNSGYSAKEYIKTMEDGNLLNKILKYIKTTHNLLPCHLDVLARNGDDLSSYWPEKSMQIILDYDPFVSKLASLSPEEFFSESFAFYMINAEIPELIKKAIEYSLKSLNVEYTRG